MASFTITEKGYNLKDTKGEFYDGVKADFEKDLKTLRRIWAAWPHFFIIDIRMGQDR